ncbi:MAG: GTPase Era [Alphaproteobacteria bacterium]|nr:MAG: GTPase Era [Alphaproteobacteria bacterium]
MSETEASTRCGYVAILGAPNAGKSTLLNRMVGTKVSIVSPKVQTTRSRVLGIALAGEAQVIFIDTPGIFTPKRRLERAMVHAAWSGAADADLVVLVVDAARKTVGDDAMAIVEGLKKADRKAILALNKVDLVRREKLLGLAAELDATGVFTDVFMISAETGDGVGDLMAALAARLPKGPWLFPEDQVSDMPMRLIAAEVTREHLFRQLHDELPYAVAVESESWEEFKDGSAKISQVVYVQRDSQKAIVLGQGGRRIRSIRQAAQAELEGMLERRIHLFLHVKVREDWPEDRARFRDLGLEYDV